MRELIINAAAWQTRDDLYISFFAVVGAPPWHGKNLDALRDSIGVGQINEIEVPYRLVLSNYNLVPPAMKKDAENFVVLIQELAAKGFSVEIRTHPPMQPEQKF